LRGSFRVAKFFGIPVELHWSFALLLGWIIFSSISSGANAWGVFINVAFVLSLFTCVVLHEFGHALTARRFGVNTKDIILSPIGGIARLDKLPEKPFQEFLVAIAGPAVNVVIAFLLMPYLIIFPVPGFFENLFTMAIFRGAPLEFVPGLITINFLLAAFNMLPAFPMDGGRILRSLLAIKFPRVTATKVAARIGQLFAVLFILWAILPDAYLPFGISNGGLLTAFIGMFVFLTANQELQSAKLESVLSAGMVRDIMRTQFTLIQPSDAIWIPVSYHRQNTESNFLVTNEDGKIIGTLEEEHLIIAIKNNQTEKEVGELIIEGEVPVLNPMDSLKRAYEKIQTGKFSILPVVVDDQLVGVLDVKLIAHYLQMQKKMGSI
jgi:Zn-dependent protease/CBS domain-containing protein